MENKNPQVDFFFDKHDKWKSAYNLLRDIILPCGLTEELKWGVPCYTYQGNNVVLIHGFRDYCALLFHKGVLLEDTHSLLIQQTPRVQAARQLRFTSSEEIRSKEDMIQAYIFEAIEVEKAGLTVQMKNTEDYDVPQEFQEQLDKDPALQAAFADLSPGRQRGYLLYFSQAKRSETRLARVIKYKASILQGRGLNDV